MSEIKAPPPKPKKDPPTSNFGTPENPEVVKTYYQLGAELHDEEHPGEDFGQLTAGQQSFFIERGVASFNKGGAK